MLVGVKINNFLLIAVYANFIKSGYAGYSKIHGQSASNSRIIFRASKNYGIIPMSICTGLLFIPLYLNLYLENKEF
jgi:hypothetical protein